ncbi:MAG: hypothetical protein EHM21_11935, partial [Chloroflexi bacterium]
MKPQPTTPPIFANLSIPAGFSFDDLQQMHAAALRVLDQLGISVENPIALDALRAAGARLEGTRAYFRPEFVQECLAVMQAQWAAESVPAKPRERLTFGVGDMCQYYHNPHNDEIEIMTTANVIEATKAVQAMGESGLGSYVPGVPRDVPAQLQAIVEYRIGAEFTRGGPTL